MKKKLLSVLLTLVLALSLTAPAFAATYKDLSGHWAESYMQALADKGYLNGYEDGTMRPDGTITAAETLVLLSRLYTPDAAALALVREDYGDYVTGVLPATLTWAHDGVMLCLAAGVVTKTELAAMKLAEPIAKEDFSVCLGRALQMTAGSGTALAFADAADISIDCRGYVEALVTAGIVQGDTDNKFVPSSGVTRAVVATMFSRALTYLTNNSRTLVLTDYDGVTRTEGVLVSVGSGTLVLRGFDGYARVYTLPAGAAVSLNGTAGTLTAAYAGSYARISAKGSTVTAVSVESSSAVTWVQGALVSVTRGSAVSLYVQSPDTGDQTRYTVPTAATLTKDGSTITLSELKEDCFVTLKLQSGTVTSVQAVTLDNSVTGTVSAISYGTTVTVDVADADGLTYRFLLDIADLPDIYRANATTGLDSLREGAAVTVAMKNALIDSITIGGTTAALTGQVVTITATTSGTKWVIRADDGTETTLDVDANAAVYKGSKELLISDVRAGDRVSVSVYGEAITEVTVVSAAASSDRTTGTALLNNTKSKTLTILLDDNTLLYVDTSAVVTIVSASTGRTMSLSAIAQNDAVTVYGTYTSAKNIKAVSIIVG